MKKIILMKKIKEYNMYQFLRTKKEDEYHPISEILGDDFRPYELINWFFNDKKTVDGNIYIDIRKEDNAIALYDISDRLQDDYIGSYITPNPEYRFAISKDNFIQLLHHWEELRISKPDIILIVIHEDNHITLETDPVIIKQYQDAGYALNIDQHEI